MVVEIWEFHILATSVANLSNLCISEVDIIVANGERLQTLVK